MFNDPEFIYKAHCVMVLPRVFRDLVGTPGGRGRVWRLEVKVNHWSIGVGDDDHFDIDFGRPGSIPLARR